MEINAKQLKTHISDSIPPSHLTNEVERKGTWQNAAQGKKEGIAAKGRRQKDSNERRTESAPDLPSIFFESTRTGTC